MCVCENVIHNNITVFYVLIYIYNLYLYDCKEIIFKFCPNRFFFPSIAASQRNVGEIIKHKLREMNSLVTTIE